MSAIVDPPVEVRHASARRPDRQIPCPSRRRQPARRRTHADRRQGPAEQRPGDASGDFRDAGDLVTIDGKLVEPPDRTRLWRYHKPEGLVTTHRDPEGRPTVFDKLRQQLPRVISVGRLDLTSEGLLLLTNDGALARTLELPATGWIRRYRVRVHGNVMPSALAALAKGLTIDGDRYAPIDAGLDAKKGDNAWLTVSLREGRNREIRRVMAHLGLDVTRLIRIAYGPFQLGTLPRGGIEEVPTRVLREQLPKPAPGPAGEGVERGERARHR